MASARDTIIAKVITDLNTITAGSGATTQTLTAYDAMPEVATKRPVAWVRTDPGELNYSQHVLANTMAVIIQVEGARDVVSELLQKIALFYENVTAFAGINALGVVEFTSEPWDEPVNMPGADSRGAIVLNMQYRISIP